ncbi:MAG: hypothetical protein REH83_00010 [Rickettsiella sp.]|nr:hypothetical protein [Rickettsiella sp.]
MKCLTRNQQTRSLNPKMLRNQQKLARHQQRKIPNQPLGMGICK